MKEVLTSDDLELEQVCPCAWSGSCWMDTEEEQKVCKRCKGTGMEPTSFGRAVLNFVRKHEGSVLSGRNR